VDTNIWALEGRYGSYEHWLNISSFSVKKLVKNGHYFSHFFFTEKANEKLKTFPALFGLFQNFHLKNEKVVKRFKKFSLMFSVKKSVKNNGHFSPIFSLKNLKCSSSGVSRYIFREFTRRLPGLPNFSSGSFPKWQKTW
jgi:hypothetical protein